MASAQDVVIIGEVHDNPAHHQVQAEMVADIGPGAIVFEMLTSDQAAKVTDTVRGSENALAEALGWVDSGWPDFAMYYPIFTASDAAIFGAAVPRNTGRQAMSDDIARTFGEGAAQYGLADPLPQAEQAAREKAQADAHCNALPGHLLPSMVSIQRFRDAVLARTIVKAMKETGAPVVVITGNGHARKDWGVPAVLARAAPELELLVIGQSEDGVDPDGEFDKVIDAPAAERPDPCLTFE